MYITIQGSTYADARRVMFPGSGNVAFIGESIPAGLDAPGVIGVYRDDGFLLREDDAAQFNRVSSQAGALLLTNRPLPEPTVVQEETATVEEIEQAIAEGVNGV